MYKGPGCIVQILNMVSRRRYTSSPRFKLALVLFLSLAALALASGAYLGTPQVAVRVTDKAVLSGIAPIYRQISAQAGQAAPARGSASFVEGSAPFAAAFLRLDEYVEGLDAAPAMEAGSPASGLHLGGVTVSRLGGPWSTRGAVSRVALSEDLTGAADLVFNNSFSSLFSMLFEPQADESGRDTELATKARNPFTEIKQKQDTSRIAATDQADAPQDKAVTESHPAEPSSSSGPEAVTASSSGARPERYVFVGDFDGSGALSILTAERSGDLAYRFEDGIRAFSLFVNRAAVESQRSLSLEDIDGDGIMDLLVTVRASLFGGVLIGDGKGGYSPSATFLTGYEPVLAAVGPETENGREIVTVNTRSGAVMRFLPGGTYRRQSAGKLDFLPGYVNHIVQQESGADYLQIAPAGGEAKLYGWPAAGRMERRAIALPQASDLRAGPDPNFGSKVGSIRIYQVGAYASIVLANAAGQTFNVANLRISPQACLVFGDLEGRGNLDVGVAHLVSFTPLE